jgi:hypothetical protein
LRGGGVGAAAREGVRPAWAWGSGCGMRGEGRLGGVGNGVIGALGAGAAWRDEQRRRPWGASTAPWDCGVATDVRASHIAISSGPALGPTGEPSLLRLATEVPPHSQAAFSYDQTPLK